MLGTPYSGTRVGFSLRTTRYDLPKRGGSLAGLVPSGPRRLHRPVGSTLGSDCRRGLPFVPHTAREGDRYPLSDKGMRSERDSNPRYQLPGIPHFQTV